MEEIAVATLREQSTVKGYITFDDIVKVSDDLNLDLSSIERISGRLLDEKIIVLEDDPPQVTGEIVLDSEYDKSQINYEELFAKVLEIAPQLENYISKVKGIPAPQAGEEHRLINEAQNGNPYARTRLIQMFLRVVIRIAHDHHKQYGVSLEDAIQEGNIGLMVAIYKFDNQLGYRYSSYAPWWIQQNIRRNLDGLWLSLYFPQYLKDVFFQVSKFVGIASLHEVQGKLTDLLSFEDIAYKTGQAKGKIEEYQLYFSYPVPLDNLTNYSEEQHWERSVEEKVLTTVFLEQFYESLEFGILSQKFRSVRNRTIFILRYGLSGNEPMTLEEIGECFGLTRERIRQILNRIEKILERFYQVDNLQQVIERK